MADETQDNLRDLVAEVSAAYFANSHVGVSEIASVIEQVAKSLGAIGVSSSQTAPEVEQPAAAKLTAAQIRKSITPEAIVSFEDGRGYKTLRRHLAVRGLTPEQYREKWGLAKDYPMVSPNYSAARSQMAKSLGLGSRRAGTGVAAASPAPRGRRKAAT